MIILIDNGHGAETKGKRSPDGRLLEYKWCREVAEALAKALTARGHQARRIVKEETDVALKTRCERVNAVCSAMGAKNVVLVSLHNNASGSGGWKAARGWSGWVYTKGGEGSRELARCLEEAAEKRGLLGNRSVPAEKYWTANFYMLKHTACAAVLTENLFQDNRDDVDYLLSEEGRKAIVELHVEGIEEYIRRTKG